MIALTVSLLLAWNYVVAPNIVFEIWHTTDLRTWTEVAETANVQWAIPPGQPFEFFKVRARDLNTGLESEWAVSAYP